MPEQCAYCGREITFADLSGAVREPVIQRLTFVQFLEKPPDVGPLAEILCYHDICWSAHQVERQFSRKERAG